MANEEFMEEMENEGTLITLEDEEGNEIEFEFLDVVEYEGEEYIVLIENDEEADEVVPKNTQASTTKNCSKSFLISLRANTKATSILSDRINSIYTNKSTAENCRAFFLTLSLLS